MRYLLTIILLLATPAMAQQADREHQETIFGQLKAFQVDDFDTAFEFASPHIQMIFRDAGNFEMMVKRGYPMVVAPADVRMLDERILGGMLWQKVQIRDRDGNFFVLDYQMINLNGVWRINAVQLIPTPDIGA